MDLRVQTLKRRRDALWNEMHLAIQNVTKQNEYIVTETILAKQGRLKFQTPCII